MEKKAVQNLDFCPYKLLELDPEASEMEIRTAYKTAALKWHPDKNKSAGARDMFEKVKLAYDILSKEETKELYDQIVRVREEQRQRAEKASGERRKLIEELLKREQEYMDKLKTKMRRE